MEQLQVTFKVVTPLFLSGTNKEQAEFRPASLKGAMRYWYRALDPNYREREPAIFGGTDKENGQAKFLLRYEPIAWKQGNWNKYKFSKSYDGSEKKLMNGIAYLGYPLDSKIKGERVQRAYLNPGTEFKVQLLFLKTTDEIRRAVLGSLWMLGHIGGLGSRSRRGFGTTALLSWELTKNSNWSEISELPIAHTAETPQEWVRLFKEGLEVLRRWFGSERQVTHTVLDSNCRFLFLNEPHTAGSGYEPWAHALNRSGQLMQDFRLRREPDYTDVKQQICALDPDVASFNKDVKAIPMSIGPQRAVFGLPLSFRYSSLKEGKGITFQGAKSNRSGSPVWIRIIEIGNKCYPFFAFMSAPLLPSHEKIIGKLNVKKSLKEGFDKKDNGNYETVLLKKPSDGILADFQHYLTRKSKVLEVR